MKFRTEYEAVKAPFTLNPAKPAVLTGSCFSQNMAARMEAHEWRASNPAGTLYNPLSICDAIDMMLDGETGAKRFEDSLSLSNDTWNSNKFDSSFSSARKEDCVMEFIHRQKQLVEGLEEGRLLIVTFGTSIVYYTSKDNIPVGNCHKLPSQLFYRKRLTIAGIVECWSAMIEKLKLRFPGIRIIFTVSPVRHLKDGFSGNSRSKAILLLAIEELLQGNEDCYYFPAYEILNDDLRDYRFYASDLTHPSEEGIEYIWEKFKQTYLDEQGVALLAEGGKRVRAKSHRPKTGALGKPLKA